MKLLLKGLIVAAGVSWFSASMLGPIYAIYVARIGGDLLDAGLSWAIYSIVLGILTIILGRFEDKVNRRGALIAGYSLITLCTLGYLFVQSPAHLFLVQALIGIGIAVVIPAWDGLFSRAVDRNKESSEWAAAEGGYQILAGLGALVGSGVVSLYGFDMLFVLMVLIQALSVLAIIATQEGKNSHVKGKSRKINSPGKS